MAETKSDSGELEKVKAELATLKAQKALPAKTTTPQRRKSSFLKEHTLSVEAVPPGEEGVVRGWVDDALELAELELEDRAERRAKVGSHPMILDGSEIAFLASLKARRDAGDRRLDATTLQALHNCAVKLGVRAA